MSNLTESAFPIFEPGGTDGSISLGFSKHEYAAILLSCAMLNMYDELPTIQEGDNIATTAHFMASQILGKFK